MDGLSARIDALVGSPAGCAFLSMVENVGIDQALEPLVTFHLLGRALGEVTIWNRDRPQTILRLLEHGPRLRSTASELLERPEAAWWFQPMARDRQLFAPTPGGTAPVSTTVSTPSAPIRVSRPPTESERYAQKPAWGLYTSTELSGINAYLIGSIECYGDLGPVRLPIERYQMVASAGAKIFDIDGPAAWHTLCNEYPAAEPGGLMGGLVVPDFALVARDWDAVHVSFGGLLAADQVIVAGPRGQTALQGWDVEQTVWLNFKFDRVVQLDNIVERPQLPVGLR